MCFSTSITGCWLFINTITLNVGVPHFFRLLLDFNGWWFAPFTLTHSCTTFRRVFFLLYSFSSHFSINFLNWEFVDYSWLTSRLFYWTLMQLCSWKVTVVMILFNITFDHIILALISILKRRKSIKIFELWLIRAMRILYILKGAHIHLIKLLLLGSCSFITFDMVTSLILKFWPLRILLLLFFTVKYFSRVTIILL